MFLLSPSLNIQMQGYTEFCNLYCTLPVGLSEKCFYQFKFILIVNPVFEKKHNDFFSNTLVSYASYCR